MRSILEELFYGNVCPNTDCRSSGDQAKELTGFPSDHHSTLMEELTEKQKEVLEKSNWLSSINFDKIFHHISFAT